MDWAKFAATELRTVILTAGNYRYSVVTVMADESYGVTEEQLPDGTWHETARKRLDAPVKNQN